ncbi:YopX family protein [Bacillus anthracis]|uniref:YopX family protein n=1 Tax=Bacillus anthracis TaxID=1392 RepID=UPI003D229249
MREIKFRAWVLKDEALDGLMENTMEYDVESFHDPLYEYKRGNIILMQYTGLKDKNGKEIYEGDILECTSELLTNFGKTKTGRYETTYKQVIWLTDSWGYRVLKSKHIVEGAERKGLEVAIKFGVICGNIYENPELLER